MHPPTGLEYYTRAPSPVTSRSREGRNAPPRSQSAGSGTRRGGCGAVRPSSGPHRCRAAPRRAVLLPRRSASPVWRRGDRPTRGRRPETTRPNVGPQRELRDDDDGRIAAATMLTPPTEPFSLPGGSARADAGEIGIAEGQLSQSGPQRCGVTPRDADPAVTRVVSPAISGTKPVAKFSRHPEPWRPSWRPKAPRGRGWGGCGVGGMASPSMRTP